jgi:hypothetical protein
MIIIIIMTIKRKQQNTNSSAGKHRPPTKATMGSGAMEE